MKKAQLHQRVRLDRRDLLRQVARVLHLFSVDRLNHIARHNPGFGGGTASLRFCDQRALCFLEAEAIADILRHALDLHAEAEDVYAGHPIGSVFWPFFFGANCASRFLCSLSG